MYPEHIHGCDHDTANAYAAGTLCIPHIYMAVIMTPLTLCCLYVMYPAHIHGCDHDTANPYAAGTLCIPHIYMAVIMTPLTLMLLVRYVSRTYTWL